MPQEDLTLKFNTQNADKAARDFDQIIGRVEKLKSAFASLGGSTGPSAAFVQMMSKGLDSARDEVGKTSSHIAGMGDHMTSTSHKMRIGAHIISGTFGQMAGSVNPMLGQMVGSLRMGAISFAALGGPIAGAVIALHLISQAVEAFVHKMKDAEEWTTKFQLAANNADMGGLKGQMSEIIAETTKLANASWLTKIGEMFNLGRTQELEARMKQLKLTYQSIYDVFEKPKAQADIKVAELGLDQQRLSFARENAASTYNLDLLLKDQLNTVKQIAAQETIRATKEAELAAMPLRALGLNDQANQMVADAKKKASLSEQMKAEAELNRQRKDALNFERDRMNESIDLAKQYTELRVTMIDSTLSEEDKARETQRIRTEMINNEIKAVKELQAAHSEDMELQRQTNTKLISLAQAKMKTEIDAVTAVLDARRKAADEEKRIEEGKAQVGKGLRGEAIESLKKQGRKGATETEISAEAERLMGWGKYYGQMQEMGQPDQYGNAMTFEQMEFAERMGGYAQQMRAAGGSTVGGAMRAAGRARENAWGGPEFKSWEELTGGKDAAAKKAAEGVAETFASVLKTELGTPQGGVVRAITDGILRQIEQEASRQ